jgi:hypothetical protein
VGQPVPRADAVVGAEAEFRPTPLVLMAVSNVRSVCEERPARCRWVLHPHDPDPRRQRDGAGVWLRKAHDVAPPGRRPGKEQRMEDQTIEELLADLREADDPHGLYARAALAIDLLWRETADLHEAVVVAGCDSLVRERLQQLGGRTS